MIKIFNPYFIPFIFIGKISNTLPPFPVDFWDFVNLDEKVIYRLRSFYFSSSRKMFSEIL